jgi:glycosyltransferase involved in cell wall biosynthesis
MPPSNIHSNLSDMQVNSNSILTIAIPTYNRAAILDEALSKVLPQIFEYKNEIELIISDNASVDGTQEVISKYKKAYKGVNIISNLQPFNTGYFGNFKKCKELSNGRYFWLLSDNEHISVGVIDKIISTIHSNLNTGAFFLADVSMDLPYNLSDTSEYFKIYQTTFDTVIRNETGWSLTGISYVIFLNDKRFDKQVESELSGNLFLGFLFLCNALRINDKITIIYGQAYTSAPCKVYFNVFQAWTKDILQGINYMTEKGLFSEEQKTFFITSYLKYVLKDLIAYYIVNGHLHGKKYNLQEIRLELYKCYSQNKYYIDQIAPIFDKKYRIRFDYYLSKLKKRLNREFLQVKYRLGLNMEIQYTKIKKDNRWD